MDIVCGVQVAVTCPTTIALEHAVSQVQVFFDRATSVACLATGKAFVNLHHVFPLLVCDPLQLEEKVCKAQIADLAAPKTLHAVQVQRLKAQRVVGLAQCVGKLPVIVLAFPRHFAVNSCLFNASAMTIV